MKQFIVLLPMLDEVKNRQHRPDHLAYLADLDQKGNIYLKGRYADGTGGVIIYNADTLEEATKLATNDPFVVHGVRACEIHEFLIV